MKTVLVEEQYLNDYSNSNNIFHAKILSISGNYAKLEVSRFTQNEVYDVHILNIKRNIHKIGANPFSKDFSKARQVQYSLESILGELRLDKNQIFSSDDIVDGKRINVLNWNPYVIGKNNEKIHYQRDFVWMLEDKQLLIDSIYNRFNIGKIVVKKNNYRKVIDTYNLGDTEICFYDIVDGKQRLNAIQEFVNDIITDIFGNYFSDLSDEAQHLFYDYMGLSYYVLPDDSTDKEILREFLCVNFTCKQTSKEHIEFVKSINL